MDALQEVKEDAHALRIVTEAYAGRHGALTAALQYIYQVITLTGGGNAEEARRLGKLSSRRLEDFELLGALVRRLGASPVFTACPPYPVSHYCAAAVNYAKSYPAMLQADLLMEQELETCFRNMTMRLGAGPVREIVSLLSDHAAENAACLAEMASVAV